MSAVILILAIWPRQCGRNEVREVISLGHRVEGCLLPSEVTQSDSSKGPAAWRYFEGQPGQEITITAESYEFEIYLYLLDPRGHQVAFADDNRGFFNATITTVLRAGGQYSVVIRAANADQVGTYSLTIEKGDPGIDWTQTGAESYYARGIEWAESSGSSRAASWVNLGMAQYFRLRRKWDQAEKYYAESLSHCGDTAEFGYIRWSIAMERGRLFARKRLVDRAIEEFDQAMELSKKVRESRECKALVLIEFGRLYNSVAKGDLAQLYFRDALKEAERDGRASTLVAVYASMDAGPQVIDKERAIEHAEKAFSLSAGLDPGLELAAMHSLAGSYLFLTPERSREGLELTSRMRRRAREIGCIDEEASALALMSMGEHRMNHVDEMIRLADESLALTSPTDEDPDPRRVALQLLADGEMSRGNYRAALGWCEKALQTVESAWAKEGVEELRLDLLSQSRAICTQIMMELHALDSGQPNPDYAREAFDYAERSRCRSLLEQLLPANRKGKLLDPVMLRRDQDLIGKLSAVRAQLALLRTSSGASRDDLYKLQQERAALITEHMKFQAEIQRSAPDTYRGAHISPLTAEEVQRKLLGQLPKTAALCYQLGIQKSFVIALTRDSCRLFELPDWTTISKYVGEWRLKMLALQNASQSESKYSEQYDAVAHDLYELLVKPAAEFIGDRDLIVVPSDALSGLAFEALVVRDPANDAEQPKYLIEQHAITYAPSLSALVGIESRWRLRKAERRILLIGGSSVNGTDTTIPGTDRSFVATLEGIPAAQIEILDIARIARLKGIGVTTWMGPAASELRVKGTDLSRYAYLHIAAHGISDPQDGGASALMLSPDLGGGHEGVLTGDEVARLKLNSDLVILSACRTGAGQTTSAEGVLGLSRNFLVAGARSVCSSLWQVEDTWTQRLMRAFYMRLISKGISKSKALRLAKLDLIKDGANPSQWAPFVETGYPR
jgi:CHAT domain-containing protein